MTIKKEINIAYPPKDNGLCVYWERSSDPWHAEAFKEIDDIYSGIKKKYKNMPRSNGWMGIDYCGNCIGYVADGTVIDEHDCDYLLKESFKGRACAVINKKTCIDIFNGHIKGIKNKNETRQPNN